MAENARPPVAVRIVRPYDTEEAFLENELETVGKTSVILIGAHSRPTGVILRFEVTLSTGATVLRGEGRVLAHKESAFRGQPGLALRFTRLDPKSKALVDRAAAIREARLAGESAPPPAPPSAPAPPAPSPPQPAVAARPSSRSGRPSAPVQAPASMPPDPVLAQILTSPTPPPPAMDAKPNERRSVPAGRRSERPSGAPSPEQEEPPPALHDEEARPSTLVDAEEKSDAAEASDAVDGSGALPSEHEVEAEAPAEEGGAGEASSSDGESAPPPRPQAITSLPMAPIPSSPPSAPPGPTDGEARAVSPPDRDALLSRLRQRAASLTEEQMAAILRRPS